MMPALAMLTVGLAAAQAAAPVDWDQVKPDVSAEISDLKSDKRKVLYRFFRRVQTDGPLRRLHISYLDPRGELAVSEDVAYDGDRLLSYSFDHKQAKQGGRLEAANGALNMTFYPDGFGKSAAKTGSVELTPGTIIGDQVECYVRAHWDALMRGESVKIRYVVLFRMSDYDFTFEKAGEEDYGGVPAAVFKMTPSNIFVSLFVSPYYLVYEKNGGRRLLESRGTAFPLREVKPGGYERFAARTVYKYSE